MPNAAAAPSPVLDRFGQECSRLAQQLGLRHIVIVVQDPANPAEKRFLASPGAKEVLRDFIENKYGELAGSDTGWDG